MTDPHDLSSGDEADALAAEYVLGVLTLEDRLAAESRIKVDTDFAGRVLAWETHFAGLNDEFPAIPAPDLMPMIEARIFGRPAAPQRRWWGYLAGVGIAVMLLLAVLATQPPTGTSGPELTASLAGEAQDLAYDARYADGILTLARLSGPDAGPGLDYELWLIVGDNAPVSLGLIEAVQTTRNLDDLEPGAVLAISLEPSGGSTTGAPTGPVLVTGVIAAI